MSRSRLPPPGQILGRTLLVLAGSYLLIQLGIAIRTNAETNRAIEQLQADIQALEAKVSHLGNQLVYFQSESYRELEAKRRLGLRRKGETSVLVPSNVEPTDGDTPQLRPPPKESTAETVSFFQRARLNAATWVNWLRGN